MSKNLKIQKFSIIEISVVLFIILLLILISTAYYKTVQRSIMVKNQQMEFENIKTAINSFKMDIRGTKNPATKHVTIYDLIYTYSLLSEKRILIVNGKDKTKANAKILSYFDTPIEVWVTKQKLNAKETDIETGYKKILGNEYLTGDFEFYFGKDHELNGGEGGPGPIGTPFGLMGNGTLDDGHQYFYKFIYSEADGVTKHEFKMH